MQRAVVRRQRPEDDADLLESPAILREHTARDTGRISIVPRFGVAPVNGAVRREVRTERYVEQTTLTAVEDRRDSGDWFTNFALRRDDPDAARFLGDQQVAARQRL